MKNAKKKFLFVSAASVFATALSLGIATSNRVSQAAAEAPLFAVCEGASVRLNSNGLRFQVQMDETTKKSIVDDDTTDGVKLYFIISPKAIFDTVEDGDYYSLYNEDASLTKCLLVEVDEEKIYSKDGNWMANGCVYNVKEQNIDLEFSAIACIMSGETVQYSSTTSTRSIYSVVNAAALDVEEAYMSALLNTYEWYGEEGHAITIKNTSEYDAFINAVNAEHRC